MRRSFKAVRDIVEKALLQNSAIVSGKIYAEGVKVTKSVSCPQEDKAIMTEQFYTLGGSKSDLLKATQIKTAPDSSLLADERSADLQTRVVVRSGADSAVFLEVYRDDSIVFKKNLKDKHGPVSTKDPFNSRPVIFNAQGTKCLYLAEIKPPKADMWADDFKSTHLEGNDYKHGFGETCDDVYNLGLFIVDLEGLTILRVKGMPKNIIPITACFLAAEKGSDQSESILITGYESSKILSGINMCLNKPSALYVISQFETEDLFPKAKKEEKSAEKDSKSETKVEEKPVNSKKLTEFPISMFPSVSPSGRRAVYFFSRYFNEAHLFTTGLAVVDLVSGESQVIVDSEETSDQERAFYVYYDAFQHMTWISEDEIAFPSFDLGRNIMNFVDLKTKARKFVVLSNEFETDNIAILDCTRDYLLLTKCNFYYRSRLGIAKDWLNWRLSESSDQAASIAWEEIEAKDSCPHRFAPGSIQETKIGIRDVTGYIWYLKSFKDEAGKEVPPEKRPLYVHFHGGPHYFSGANYSTLALVMMKQGYQYMSLNFSGSWSFGKSFNERLCGKVGEIDCEELVDWMKANTDKYDVNNVTFDGGSYSGLQSVALLQKHHGLFKHIIAYNPVVNLVSNFYQTDIPEWNFVEAFGVGRKYNVDEDLTDDDILKMKKLSPALQHFDKDTKTKVLFIIGDKDRRVPPSACLYLYRKLKAIGIDVKCRVYKDQGHGIRKPAFVIDYLMNIFDMLFDFSDQVTNDTTDDIKIKEIVVKRDEAAEKDQADRLMMASDIREGDATTADR